MEAEMSGVSVSQGTPSIAKSHRNQEQHGRILFQDFWREEGSAKNLAFGLLVSRSVRDYIFYCFMPQSLWSFLTANLGDSYKGNCHHGSNDHAGPLTTMTVPVPLSFIHPDSSFTWPQWPATPRNVTSIWLSHFSSYKSTPALIEHCM